jgi:enoyl-CoA hydratase
MVGKIFAAEELSERTVEFARRIARIDTMAALLIKESVNQTVDNMGFHNALNACFSMHQVNHSAWAERTGGYPAGTPELGVPAWNDAPPVRPAVVGEP